MVTIQFTWEHYDAHTFGLSFVKSVACPRIEAHLLEELRAKDLTRTELGSRVICEDRELLYEEAPAAYKNIADVVQDLVDAELVSVVATFQPNLTEPPSVPFASIGL